MNYRLSIFQVLLVFSCFQTGYISASGAETGRQHTQPSGHLDSFGTNQWEISGPDELCLYYGSIIGDFFGGGLVTDVFRWKVTKDDGIVQAEREGGFQQFSHTFSQTGLYEIELTVRRGIDLVFNGTKTIKINPGADLVLEGTYLLCDQGTATLTLINPAYPGIDNFRIQWLDPSGSPVSNANSITVNREGRYTVRFASLDENGNETCPFSINAFVYVPRDFSITSNVQEVCEGQSQINVNAGSGVFGKWYALRDGESEKRMIGEGSSLNFMSNSIGGPGEYQIIFEVDNTEKRYCKISDSIPLKVLPPGDVAMRLERAADACDARNGEMLLEALTDLTLLRLRRDNTDIARFENVTKGEVFQITGLAAGLYRATGSFGACSRTRVLVVPMSNPPAELQFEVSQIINETCNETGKVDGQVKIHMAQPGYIGSFRLLSATGTVVRSGHLDNIQDFEINAPAGTYYLELANPSGCVNPAPNRIVIGTKGQVNFSVPNRFGVCSYYDFVPTTNQNLVFKLLFPSGQEVIKSKGEAFRLDEEGEYSILGMDTATVDALCPRELKFYVRVTNPVHYEPELVSTDCFGNKQYWANLFGADPSKVNIRWINERDETVGTEQFLFPTSHGEFKLDVQPKDSEVCPVPPIIFTIERPVLEVAAELNSGILCPGSQTNIYLETDYDLVKNVIWLFIDQNGNIEALESYLDLPEITIRREGTYEAVLFNALGCEVGRKFLTVPISQELAEFEIPESLIVCDSYELVPISERSLSYSVQDPQGNRFFAAPGEPLRLSIPGTYRIDAESANPDDPLCQVTKTIQVIRLEPVRFEPVLAEHFCDGNLTYTAEIFGANPESLDFYWYNERNELVGREAYLVPESFGMFGLEVRPKGSLSCPEPNRLAFEVFQPITSLEVNLEATPLCPNGDLVQIFLTTEHNHVGKIVWHFVDFDGARRVLGNFDNQTEIETGQEGTYEAEVFNKLGCLVGSDIILVLRSTDERRPDLEAQYSICPRFGEKTEINPGNFQAYQWILDGKVASDQPVFSPTEVGTYTLRVTSDEGCIYEGVFSVVEACELKVTHTTGMRLADPQRTFKVYHSALVDHLEVWIYNSWGQLVFFGNSPRQSEQVIEWDGSLNGTQVQPGSYAVKIRYKNSFENEERSIWSSLTILE